MGRPTRVLDRSKLAADVRALSRLSPARGLLAIAREWLFVGLSVFAAVASGHPLVWLLAGIFIATRQHAMMVLMHEASHYRLTGKRPVDDSLADLLLALPNHLLTRRYRIRHIAHHQFANDRTRDPDRVAVLADDQWWFPRPRWSGAAVFMRDLLGINFPRFATVIPHYSPWTALLARFDAKAEPSTQATNAEVVRTGIYCAALLGTLAWTGGWLAYAVLWLLPGVTVLPALLRLRGLAEHDGDDVGTDEVSVSRHVEVGAAEALLLAPFHINHHAAHHLFPSGPWYNLPALHARLLEEPSYRDHLVTAPSYTGPGGLVDILMPVGCVRQSTPAMG
jgi:fatty acid desaturase